MTWHKKTVTVLGLALAAGVSACDQGLTDVNKNPNAPETASPALLFPTAAIATARQLRSAMELTPVGILWAQHLAEYQYPEISYYQFRPATADGWWLTFYAGPLQDLTAALRVTSDAANPKPNQTGPILVIRAFAYSTMTGMWGDIPFSQANTGDLATGTYTPIYDTQKSVYDSLLKNLADANTMMGAAAGSGFGAQDPVYGGDAAKWKKFANSLRARLGLNLSRADAARAQSEVAAAIAAGGFASNADIAQISWPGDGTNNSPWWDNLAEGQGTRDDARSASTFIDTLKSLSDPRLPIFFRPVQVAACGTTPLCTDVPAGGYRGMPVGLEAAAAAGWGTKSSRLGAQVFAADQPSYYMTYAEFAFIKAEARERGWITTGTAAQYYNEAITATMEQWGVSAANIATYLAQPAVVYVPGATGLRQIGLQKWIALFTQGYEAWSEWRRTGFPNLTPAANARTTGAVIPRRVSYPQTEQSFNNTNLQAAISAQGGSDELHKKLYIDP